MSVQKAVGVWAPKWPARTLVLSITHDNIEDQRFLPHVLAAIRAYADFLERNDGRSLLDKHSSGSLLVGEFITVREYPTLQLPPEGS